MRLFSNLVVCLALGCHASLGWSQTISSCTVTPHPNVSVESLQVEALGQNQVQIHFQTVAGPASDTCLISEESQSRMIVICAIEHGKIELVIERKNSRILLSAEGRSGRKFQASSSMNCH